MYAEHPDQYSTIFFKTTIMPLKKKYTHTFKIKSILKAKEVKIVHKNNKQNIKRGKKEKK